MFEGSIGSCEMAGNAAAAPRPCPLASPPDRRYIGLAKLRGASGDIIPGALSILKGAVPDRTRGSGHTAPTYFRREPGIERSNGHCGFALFLLLHEPAGSADASARLAPRNSPRMSATTAP